MEVVPMLGPDVYEMIQEKLHNRCDCCDQRLYAVWKNWDTGLVARHHVVSKWRSRARVRRVPPV